MKKAIFLFLSIIPFTVFGQPHFQTVPMTGVNSQIIILNVEISGNQPEIGDEIGVFDDTLCVGAAVFQGNYPVNFPIIYRYVPPVGPPLPGAVSGDSMIFKLWDSSEQSEYAAQPIFQQGNGYFPEPGALIIILSLNSIPQTITVNLTPHNPPIRVPAAGGRFYFNVEVMNSAGRQYRFDCWTQITYIPRGNSIIPLSASNVLINPGSRSFNLSQLVPALAPAGEYIYYAYMGNYPWLVRFQDSFPFEKLGDDESYWPDSPQNWPCEGDFFGSGLKLGGPDCFSLHRPIPNPFNQETHIAYSIAQAGIVSIVVYDVQGREAARLFDGWRAPGIHNAIFNASGLSSGIYFTRLTAEGCYLTKKLLLVK